MDLAAVFETVMVWAKEGKAVSRAHRALHLRGHQSIREPEPFAAVILCTSDPDKVDCRTRSKWSRALRYAAEFKDLGEPLADFLKRAAVSTHARRGLLVVLGDSMWCMGIFLAALVPSSRHSLGPFGLSHIAVQ
jgi:hypothetical protein